MAIDRRTRFREYMRRLDPTGDPAQAVDAGFYIAPPDAMSRRIATRIELHPEGGHLLVGGIGTGKTTELIAIERQLAQIDDLLPVRVDVPSRHRLDKLKPGVLLALAGTEACAELSREREQGLVVDKVVEDRADRISDLAMGYWRDYPEYDQPNEPVWVEGILEEPQLSGAAQALSKAFHLVHGVLRRKLVLLFDGLDRVLDLARLSALLRDDVPAMSRAGVGLVIVGPQHLRFSPQRTIEQVFETVYLHGATGAHTPEGETFLTAVLRARVGEDVLPPDSAKAVIRWSGGIMRDLVALGRAACAEAYAGGSDAIQPQHVDIAADRFGRDLLLGCTKEMAARLKELVPRKRGPITVKFRPDTLPAFTVATELDQRLLMERLIVEVPGTPVHYVLHPAIEPLIPGLGVL